MDVMVYDPALEIRDIVRDENGQPYQVQGFPRVKIAVKVARDAALKFGYKLEGVPVINRNNGSMRAWNLGLNTHCVQAYAEALVDGNWRIMKPEENDSWQKSDAIKRKDIARRNLMIHDQAVKTLEQQQHFQNMIDTALTGEKELAQFSPEDIAILEKRIADAKEKIVFGKEKKSEEPIMHVNKVSESKKVK